MHACCVHMYVCIFRAWAVAGLADLHALCRVVGRVSPRPWSDDR